MTAWNKGKAVGQMAPLSPRHVHAIKTVLTNEGNLRDFALFSTAVDTMLRAVDLLALKVEDVTDDRGDIREEIAIQQQKTGVAHLVALSPATQQALRRWIQESGKVFYDFLFTGTRKGKHAPITRQHYARLVKQWVRLVRLNPDDFSTHSLRRTKASVVFQETGNIEVVRELLGQRSVNATSAYLNVGKRKALEIGKRFDF